uniref:Ig-like domain-containing protein n=1 Tax=Scleropages formosus TaxID=113540 RepID=A0A8C9WDX9_SCLFO
SNPRPSGHLVVSCKYCVLFFPEIRAQDTVTQSTGDVTGYEGGSVTLSCNYTTSITGGHYLFWYIQRPHDSPKYMLKKFSFGGEEHAPGFQGRFNVSLNTSMKMVPLTIEDVQLCDSAVYYCALKVLFKFWGGGTSGGPARN